MSKRRHITSLVLTLSVIGIILITSLIGAGYYVKQKTTLLNHLQTSVASLDTTSHIKLPVLTTIPTQPPVSSIPKSTVIVNKNPSKCSRNTLDKLVLVSLSQQYMWACQGTTIVYESAVTTGAYTLAGDATPTGTWHIYAMQTNLYLNGSDGRSRWHDFVQYWVPFYSDYGFHDASWQTFNFGGSEYATNGSHGCVHMPLAAMAWLYHWSHIGTTVTIEM